ncbi:MAG: COX15/CtaA family protein [Herminiimonas sp.]|nr:COX15/CtaA family protein [Herminiimonas sp.]
MQLPHVLQLAALGLMVALLPLSLVWASTDDKVRKLAAVTLFLTFDLIVFGGFTRLTDSGLGCPDWPGCYGQANPLQAHADISAAQAAMPSGPVTVVKAWIEMIHRYLAMAVGVLIVSLMVLAWRRWWRARRTLVAPSAVTGTSPWLPTFLFAFVCLQGAFGAWTVTLKLQPVIVTIHLLLGMGLLGLLSWLYAQQHGHPVLEAGSGGLRLPARIAFVLLVLQIALGGWVSTNYATLACTDFPLCHGEVIPTMDFSHGFTLWRKLGMTSAGDYLPFSALTAIHWVHRNFAFVVIAAAVWAARRALKVPVTRTLGFALLGAVSLQFFTGVATIYLQWPLALAVAHNAGAALLVLVLVMLNYRAGIGRSQFVSRPDRASSGPLRPAQSFS